MHKEIEVYVDDLSAKSLKGIKHITNLCTLIQMSIHEAPAYCHNIEEEMDYLPWYHGIFHYIWDQQYLKHTIEIDKRTI